MKNALWKRLGAAWLVLLFLSLGTGGALAGILEISPFLAGWLEEEGRLHFSLSYEVNALLPFTQRQTDMMNQLLKHMSVWAVIEQAQEDSVTTMAMTCDGEIAGTFVQRTAAGYSTLESSLLPNRVLQGNGVNVADFLFAEEPGKEEDTPKLFDLAAAVLEAETSYRDLMEACSPWLVKKKANYRIKDVGTAKWSEMARLTPEQSEEVMEQIRAVLLSGMDAAHREELAEVTCGKGFVVGLYKTEENGQDMAVYMKGTLVYPDKSTATISYQWAFSENKQRTNIYKYDLAKKGKGGMSRKVAGSLVQGVSQSQINVDGTSTVTEKRGTKTSTVTEKIDLAGQMNDTARTLEGTITDTLKVTENKKTETIVERITPNLVLTVKEGSSAMSGTVQVEKEKNKALISALTLQLDGEVPESFRKEAENQSLYRVTDKEGQVAAEIGTENYQHSDVITIRGSAYQVGNPPLGLTRYYAPLNQQILSVASLSEANLKGIQEEMAQRFAGKLLVLLGKLPEQDLALLKDGMTSEDYQRFLSLLGAL